MELCDYGKKYLKPWDNMSPSFGLLCQVVCHCDKKLNNIPFPDLNPYIIGGDSPDTTSKN